MRARPVFISFIASLSTFGCGGIGGVDAAGRTRVDSVQVAELTGRRDSLLEAKADSIAALDPAREFAAAVARKDLRPIGVCGYACRPAGVDPADFALIGIDSMIIVSGTGDAISGPGMMRLNVVADTYATRYNQLLIEHLKAGRGGR